MNLAERTVCAQLAALLLLSVLVLTNSRECSSAPYLAPDERFTKHMHPGKQCIKLRKVCTDAGAIIIYDEKELDRSQLGWPGIKYKHDKEYKHMRSWPMDHLPDLLRHARRHPNETVGTTGYRVSELCLRLPTEGEYANMKMHRSSPEQNSMPFFSKCTIPIYMAGPWAGTNVGEYFSRIPSFLNEFQHANVIDGNLTVAVHNFASLPLSPWQHHTMQPFSTLAPTTTAVFQTKHSPDAPSKYSHEGVWGTQCYEQMVLCSFSELGNVVGAGHTIRRYWQPQYLNMTGQFWKTKEGTVPGPRVLKVLIEQRSGSVGTREILNLEELVEECNNFEGWPSLLLWNRSGPSLYDQVLCKTRVFGANFLEDLSILHDTNVLMGIHGAGLMHTVYLRPNSTLIELRPFQAGTTHNWPVDLWWPRICQGFSRVRCWFFNIEEDGSYTPGALEKLNRNTEMPWRDRNIIFKFSYLKFILHQAASPTSSAHWKEMYWQHRTAFTVLPNGTIARDFSWGSARDRWHKEGKILGIEKVQDRNDVLTGVRHF